MKTVFFGTSIYSAHFLGLAVKNGLKIDLIVSAPPKVVGRKKILTENPTVSVAKKLKIPFVTSLTNLQTHQPTNPPTLGLILDYNRIIPHSIINHFEKGIINIHFSKLPQYRGPSPVQQTILDGKTETWISYFLISKELDTGDILFQSSEPINPSENTQTLYFKLIKKASKEIKKISQDYLSGKTVPQPQKGEPSYTKKFTSDNCKISQPMTDGYKEKLIRACFPEPGAWTMVELGTMNNEQKIRRLKILKAHLEDNLLIFDLVQLEGKNPVTWKQFKEGYPEARISNF